MKDKDIKQIIKQRNKEIKGNKIVIKDVTK
jgi:hypothetical protein